MLTDQEVCQRFIFSSSGIRECGLTQRKSFGSWDIGQINSKRAPLISRQGLINKSKNYGLRCQVPKIQNDAFKNKLGQLREKLPQPLHLLDSGEMQHGGSTSQWTLEVPGTVEKTNIESHTPYLVHFILGIKINLLGQQNNFNAVERLHLESCMTHC